MVFGVLVAMGILPIRIGFTPEENRNWRRTTRFGRVSILCFAFSCVWFGALYAWADKIPLKNRLFIASPGLLAFAGAAVFKALDSRSSTPSIASMTYPEETTRCRQISIRAWFMAAAAVWLIVFMVWMMFKG